MTGVLVLIWQRIWAWVKQGGDLVEMEKRMEKVLQHQLSLYPSQIPPSMLAEFKSYTPKPREPTSDFEDYVWTDPYHEMIDEGIAWHEEWRAHQRRLDDD
jgi:hypothetical protein